MELFVTVAVLLKFVVEDCCSVADGNIFQQEVEMLNLFYICLLEWGVLT